MPKKSIEIIREDFREAAEVLDRFLSDSNTWTALRQAGDMLVECLRANGKILSCGNGGSMCDAMHFAEELSGRFRTDRRPLGALALGDPSHITCVANDFGLPYIFSRQVEALGQTGDVLLAISTSGDSPNVLEAARAARTHGMKIVALTGKTGGGLAALCDVEIRAPKTEFSDRAQEIHEKVIHALVHYIELELGL